MKLVDDHACRRRPALCPSTAGRQIGRPVAYSEDKIEYVRLLRAQVGSLGVIAAKTGIPKTSLHRYLTPTAQEA
ncbi:hypothetical protein ACQPZP_12525 [Spirillospora sp. CA-142024]|uniref:hypothetical protein n=1 Tax=Spirillospora sp. CA-142024 TaxID=3240036 RepID=UPI003D936AFB